MTENLNNIDRFFDLCYNGSNKAVYFLTAIRYVLSV